MGYISLYRKWRPQVFEDVVEQEHVVKTLRNSVTTGRISHAYLFCGTRGTGKTTMAHIFSRAINCLHPVNGDPCNECEICKGILSGSILDVVEIDAASNNSVDNVREIRDEVIYSPSQAKYKVYIIDEVHMLSSGAFNALLKTLEEPPAHVVFILATTEPHKLPATILSRCQRFDFRRITSDSIIGRLQKIAGAGGVTLQEDAARLIARMSEGALRDAITILDQCISMGNSEVSYNDVISVAGMAMDTFMADMVDAANNADVGRILELVDELVMSGKDVSQFVSDLVFYYRDLLVCKITGAPESVIEASPDALDRMKQQCGALSRDGIIGIIKELSAAESGLKWSSHPRVLLEVALIKICEHLPGSDNSDIYERLAALEDRLNSGTFMHKNLEKEPSAAADKPVPPVSAKEPAPKPKTVLVGGTSEKSSGQSRKKLDIWDSVLSEIKGKGKMALYTNLLSTSAVELDAKIVGVVFGPGSSSFNKIFVSKAENLETLETVLAGKLGRQIRVKCINEDEIKETAQKENDAPEDEFLEKAKDIADRLNMPLNVIDE